MKAIVANLLLGSFLCCLTIGIPARANTKTKIEAQTEIPEFLSAKSLIDNRYYLFPRTIINLEAKELDYAISLEDREYISQIINLDNPHNNYYDLISNVTTLKNQIVSLDKNPYTHNSEQSDIILGFHHTFWPSQNQQKYWGLTTIEQWGKSPIKSHNLQKLNHNDSVLSLPSGNSALTFSGGGGKNLVTKQDLRGEFEDFRGGVAFHQGVTNDVTLGVGFVYEDLFQGFSQFTYQPQNFPLQTTVSLIAAEEGLELHSHFLLKPTDNFVFNLYTEQDRQKFNLDWKLVPGLSAIAKGDSQKKSLNTGFKFAIGDGNFALSARAELDNHRHWQWQLNSRLGHLKFSHASNLNKTKSEIDLEIFESKSLAIQCSFFVRYETRIHKNEQEYLNIWGWHWNSSKPDNQKHHQWTFDLGYGFGSQGEGVIASTSTALSSDLRLKLTYQEISPVSQDTNIKLQIESP